MPIGDQMDVQTPIGKKSPDQATSNHYKRLPVTHGQKICPSPWSANQMGDQLPTGDQMPIRKQVGHEGKQKANQTVNQAVYPLKPGEPQTGEPWHATQHTGGKAYRLSSTYHQPAFTKRGYERGQMLSTTHHPPTFHKGGRMRGARERLIAMTGQNFNPLTSQK